MLNVDGIFLIIFRFYLEIINSFCTYAISSTNVLTL